MNCQALPELQSARRRNASRGAALTLLSGPAMIVVFLALARVIAAERTSPAQMLALLVGASAPWLLLAALQANARTGWPLIVSVLPWLVVEFSVLLSSGVSAATLWLVPLACTFYGWVSIRQAVRGEPAFLSELGPVSSKRP